MSLSGHVWTLRQYFNTLAADGLPPTLTRWERTALDAKGNNVRLTGRFADHPSDELLIVLHGLGGSIESRYMPRALHAARTAGMACLLLNARGAGDTAGGVSHAGLSDDLTLALSDTSLKRYQRLYILGYSMGGHIALRYASLNPDVRLRSVVALCSPLDLRASMYAFDRAPVSVYRWHVLRGLVASYRNWARQHAVPIPVDEASRLQKIFDWDERVVAPSFGFANAWDYYDQSSAANSLSALKVPALYVGARHDPMVPPATVERALNAASQQISTRWSRTGGHLAFPNDFSLGIAPGAGLEVEALAWLETAR